MAAECWLWTGYCDSKGYGIAGFKGKARKAHRVSFELTFGPIPAGAHVLHSCDNPPCVNPHHLHLGTHTDNMREKVARGRDFNARKTHCHRGHPFNEANTYITPNGRRNCKECRRVARRLHLARRKAAA